MRKVQEEGQRKGDGKEEEGREGERRVKRELSEERATEKEGGGGRKRE